MKQEIQIKKKLIVLTTGCAFILHITAFSQQFPEGKSIEISKRLDSLATAYLNEVPIAGFSVAVFQGSDTLLLKGYGKADVGLNVPATFKNRYRLVGPTTTMLAALLMQQVEQGRIELDEDITKHLPDFPWQGRKVTLRQLMDATSGLPDYHYLGDPFEEEIAIPKSQDEVTALFAGRSFTHEPGERQQWTISGFHLAGVLLERITGRSFKELIEEEIVRTLGLKNTCHCNGREIISDLATGYDATWNSLLMAQPESPSIYPFEVSVCASSGDVAHFYRSLRQRKLINPESYQLMTTPSAAAEDALEHSGQARVAGIGIGNLEGHPMTLEFGTLGIGYSSAVLDFSEEDLTVVVLYNTSGIQYRALPINLSRAVLNLSLKASEKPAKIAPLKDLSITSEESSLYTGTYLTRFVNAPLQYENWQRTYRIYNENSRLMIKSVGQVPERLLRQKEQIFAYASAPDVRVFFTMEDGLAKEISFQVNGHEVNKGPRIEEKEEMNNEK